MTTKHKKAKEKLNNPDPFLIKQLIYPTDLMDEKNGLGQYILFNVSETKGSRYSSKNRFIENPDVVKNPYGGSTVISKSKTSLRGKFNNATRHLKESIVLYMPEIISVDYGINYENTEFGFVGRAVATGMGGLSVKSIAKSALNELATTAAGAVQTLTGANIKDLKDLYTGTITNEMMEVTFKGVNSRNLQYQFKFTPRNENESKIVKEIIRRFKMYSHPYLKDGLINYFTNPFVFDISYLYKGKANNWLHRLSSCVLQNIKINYSGGGEFSTFENGAPTITIMDLSFIELEILTADMFEDSNNSF